jgi:L-2,4-diaminobutyric acid acetyltransferase
MGAPGQSLIKKLLQEVWVMCRPDGPEHLIGASVDAAGIFIAEPVLADGPHLWRLARDSRVLDLNSSYAYLLWCRDFAATSVVAKVDGNVVGFVTGYVRPMATRPRIST